MEVPVERISYVKKPVEKIVEKPYDVFKENIVYKNKYIDIDEKDIYRYPNCEREKTFVQKKYVDKVINKPKYIENII